MKAGITSSSPVNLSEQLPLLPEEGAYQAQLLNFHRQASLSRIPANVRLDLIALSDPALSKIVPVNLQKSQALAIGPQPNSSAEGWILRTVLEQHYGWKSAGLKISGINLDNLPQRINLKDIGFDFYASGQERGDATTSMAYHYLRAQSGGAAYDLSYLRNPALAGSFDCSMLVGRACQNTKRSGALIILTRQEDEPYLPEFLSACEQIGRSPIVNKVIDLVPDGGLLWSNHYRLMAFKGETS